MPRWRTRVRVRFFVARRYRLCTHERHALEPAHAPEARQPVEAKNACPLCAAFAHASERLNLADAHAPLKTHPIAKYTELAQRRFDAKVKRQSKTLNQAVDEYKRRYNMNPPRGFDNVAPTNLGSYSLPPYSDDIWQIVLQEAGKRPEIEVDGAAWVSILHERQTERKANERPLQCRRDMFGCCAGSEITIGSISTAFVSAPGC